MCQILEQSFFKIRGFSSTEDVEIGYSNWFYSFIFFKRLLIMSRVLLAGLSNGACVKEYLSGFCVFSSSSFFSIEEWNRCWSNIRYIDLLTDGNSLAMLIYSADDTFTGSELTPNNSL